MAMENESAIRDERWEAQLRKGCLDLAILAVLWNRRLYGLEILRHLQETSGLELAEGTLYPILLRLKQDALVESAWVDGEASHPRKYYWLTAAGRERASAMIQTWDAFTGSISRLLAQVKENSQ
jgi:PadR family transcriptional regulator